MQLDSYTKLKLSETRIQRIIREPIDKSLKGKKVLEVGCGAGRFTEILAQYADEIYVVDATDAILACKDNTKDFKNIKYFKCDLLNMPFLKASFDVVVCIGVLQHTENVKKSVVQIAEFVKPGGKIYVDCYTYKWKNLPPPLGGFGNIFRLFVKRLDSKKALSVTKIWVDYFFPKHWKYRNSKIMQALLFRISPVRFYYPWLGLKSREDYYQWALLDTYDGSADYYKHRKTLNQLKSILESANLIIEKIEKAGNGIEAEASKPYL